jgi:ribosome maturation factor RimP
VPASCENDCPAGCQFSLYSSRAGCYSPALRPGSKEKWERTKTIQAIEAVLRPPIEGLGYELVAVQLRPEVGRLVLRLLVDRPGGITLKECAGISREVGPHLDVADLIRSHYALEVSSPGIQRPLVREQDYERFRDQRVVLKTREAVDGRKTFRGINRGLDGEGRVVVDDRDTGRRHAVPLVKVREAHLDPEIQF